MALAACSTTQCAEFAIALKVVPANSGGRLSTLAVFAGAGTALATEGAGEVGSILVAKLIGHLGNGQAA